MNSQRLLTGFGLITVSLAVHGSLFYSVDHALTLYQTQAIREQKRAERGKESPIQLQFVETPRVPASKKPVHAKRISDRDALAQDLSASKIQTEAPPSTALQGVADQLAQRQSSFSQAPSPQVEPKKAVQAQKEETEKQEVEKKNDKNVTASSQLLSPDEKVKPSDLSAQITAVRPPEDAEDPRLQVRNAVRKDPQEAVPAAKQRAEVRGLGGADKITTQEMSRVKSPGAQLFGQTSFEATGSGMGAYMKNLKEKIWLAWFPYLAYQYPQDFRGADVVVNLTLDSQGKVRIVQLVDSIGSPVFAVYCVEAVQRASGFGPVPREILELIGKDELELKFGFHYR